MERTQKSDPQCWGGSLSVPGCAAERYKAIIAELEAQIVTARAEERKSCYTMLAHMREFKAAAAIWALKD